MSTLKMAVLNHLNCSLKKNNLPMLCTQTETGVPT